jgi:hypothetical protein
MLWERGHGLHPIDRALLVLRQALPKIGYDKLAQLRLGRRDRLLVQVRQQNFGDRIEAHSACEYCSERVEFSLSCSALLADTETAQPARRITIDGVSYELRCPNSLDLAAAVSSDTVEVGTETLLMRCVDCLAGEGAPVFTPERQAAIAAAMSALDPAGEILLLLSCPACEHSWEALFDIEKFLWTELRARARRVLQEVDVLARVYHWTETEILTMSESRRALYLEMTLS